MLSQGYKDKFFVNILNKKIKNKMQKSTLIEELTNHYLNLNPETNLQLCRTKSVLLLECINC